MAESVLCTEIEIEDRNGILCPQGGEVKRRMAELWLSVLRAGHTVPSLFWANNFLDTSFSVMRLASAGTDDKSTELFPQWGDAVIF